MNPPPSVPTTGLAADREAEILTLVHQFESELAATTAGWPPPAPGRRTRPASLAGAIDHTLLRPTATAGDIAALCREAREHRFFSVCVNGTWVAACAEALRGSDVLVCAVVGFPLGACSTATKVFETRDACARGAREIDMVAHLGGLVGCGPGGGGDLAAVAADIRAVVEAAAPARVKVILETAALDDTAKVAGCVGARLAGAAFVKTSTGFGPGGATAHDVALLRLAAGEEVGVKASGGIRTAESARLMLQAGADRIGASASVEILARMQQGVQ
jgi:deoxyribose-phosphate aldolase